MKAKVIETGPKMVSLDKVIEFLKTKKYQEFAGGHLVRLIPDNILEDLRKEFE